MNKQTRLKILIAIIIGSVLIAALVTGLVLHFALPHNREENSDADFSELTYVAIGDSITAGADSTRGYAPMDYPYPELVKERVA